MYYGYVRIFCSHNGQFFHGSLFPLQIKLRHQISVLVVMDLRFTLALMLGVGYWGIGYMRDRGIQCSSLLYIFNNQLIHGYLLLEVFSWGVDSLRDWGGLLQSQWSVQPQQLFFSWKLQKMIHPWIPVVAPNKLHRQISMLSTLGVMDLWRPWNQLWCTFDLMLGFGVFFLWGLGDSAAEMNGSPISVNYYVAPWCPSDKNSDSKSVHTKSLRLELTGDSRETSNTPEHSYWYLVLVVSFYEGYGTAIRNGFYWSAWSGLGFFFFNKNQKGFEAETDLLSPTTTSPLLI